jgi:DNA-binding transcriptional LysR family regulator
MTPDQLITFAAVAESGSISQAAESLHLSQPAVSGQLRLLQEDFGEPLYRREGRGIRLTATGEQLAGMARQLRQTYERARRLREAIAGLQAGSLAIGASTTPASYLLPYIVADFRQYHPRIGISLGSGNTAQVLAELSRFDFAFIEGDVPQDLPADMLVMEWKRDAVVAIVRPDHSLARCQPTEVREGMQAGGASLAAVSSHPLVMREAGSGVRHQVTQAFRSAGLSMDIALELAGVEGVKEAVRAGLGVGFVSAMAMQHDRSLVALHIDSPCRIDRHISILVPHADALGTPARAFLQHCLADAPEPPRIQSQGSE